MDNIKFYEISEEYIDYLSPYVSHLFHNTRSSLSSGTALNTIAPMNTPPAVNRRCNVTLIWLVPLLAPLM